MPVLDSELIAPGLATLLLVLFCYIGGRIHQFFKQTQEREQAYRDGYNTATRSLFSLATRTTIGTLPDLPAMEPLPGPIRGYASVEPQFQRPRPARHRAEGEREIGPADTHQFKDWPQAQQAA